MREARQAIDQKKYPASLVDFNNDPAITFADLQKLLQQVEQRLAPEPDQ